MSAKKIPARMPVFHAFDEAVQLLDQAVDAPAFFDETKEVQRIVREATRVLLKGVVPK